ncbi:hypothetical protein ACFL02_05570, partial [Planctomycetota bacterium]
MRRLLRKGRGRKLKKSLSGRFLPRERSDSALVAEPLERRLLLTTLFLPKDAFQPTTFVYIDPEEYSDQEDIADVDVFNEIRVGTLSGEPPGKNIYVEILDYEGQDIHGDLFIEGNVIPIGGGPGGLVIIEEVPPDVFGGLGDYAINALSINSMGQAFGMTEDGWLVQIDTTTGQAFPTAVGEIIDVREGDEIQNKDIIFSDSVYGNTFEAATFDPTTGTLYAALRGPTAFNEDGDILSYGTVLITIDPATGEAGPAGRNPDGNPSYAASVIDALDIRTIVNDNPEISADILGLPEIEGNLTFIGYDADATVYSFVAITLEEVGDGEVVTTYNLVTASEDDMVEGLMYDNDNRLFALYHERVDEGETEDDGVLMYVDLADSGNLLTEVVPYLSDADPAGMQIYLTGMSYDIRGLGTGYATDPVSNTLYTISVNAVVTEGGDVTITAAVSDIYTMYIASSTPDIYITLTQFEIDSNGNWIYRPTEGDQAILFGDYTTPDDAGGAMIGTTYNGENWTATTFDNSSERTGFMPQKGIWPGGYLRPGIQMPSEDELNPLSESGEPLENAIGRIQVGGGVFGDVKIEGSIGRFYAGFLGTNRFEVAGDLGYLVVGTQAGGTWGQNDRWHPAGGGLGGPILNVTGQMGGFYSNQEWGQPIRVRGNDNLAVSPYVGILAVDLFATTNERRYVPVQQELEYKVLPDGQPNQPIEFMDGALDEIIMNDSFETAQFLGTLRSDKIEVVGNLEANGDAADYYSFGAMAGQTITIKGFDTLGPISLSGIPLVPDSEVPIPYVGFASLYDPDQTLVSVLSEQDVASLLIKPLQYTTPKAGVYTVMISGPVSSYLLEISGVTETTLGGGNVLLDMLTGDIDLLGTGEVPPTIQVLNGSVGAINIGGRMRSGLSGPIFPEIKIENGDLAALRGSFSGLEVIEWPVYLYVNGDIGSVHTLENSNIDVTAKGNLQYLRADTNFTGNIVVWNNIGVIEVIGDFTDIFEGRIEFSSLYANADGEGPPDPRSQFLSLEIW